VNKLLTFFLFCFAACTILCMIMEGKGGPAATSLTSDLDNTTTTINVTSTKDFLDVDYVWVGDEKIAYTGKTGSTFTGCTRGVDGTIAIQHASGYKVYNESSNVMYSMLGFNVGVSNTTFGTFKTLTQTVLRIVRVIPRVIAWDYSFLGDSLTLIKYVILYPLSAGLIFTLAMYFRNLILG